MARRVRADQRWEAVVGASGGQPGSIARKGRSLDADHVPVDTSQGGGKTWHMSVAGCRRRSGYVRRRRSSGSAAAGKPCTEGFLEIETNVRTRRRASWGSTSR
jgi:hypothetical protein